MRDIARYFVIALLLAGCGKSEPPAPAPPSKPQPTVFDTMVEKERTLPAAVNAAQNQHMDDTRRAVDAAEDSSGSEPPR